MSDYDGSKPLGAFYGFKYYIPPRGGGFVSMPYRIVLTDTRILGVFKNNEISVPKFNMKGNMDWDWIKTGAKSKLVVIGNVDEPLESLQKAGIKIDVAKVKEVKISKLDADWTGDFYDVSFNAGWLDSKTFAVDHSIVDDVKKLIGSTPLASKL